MNGLKPLSHGVKKVSGKTFEKKFVALGRVLENWPAIIGNELAAIAQPAKIKMRKSKGEYLRTLVIDVPASSATFIHYQKGLIMERMSRLLGAGFIYDIECISSGQTGIKEAGTTKAPKEKKLNKKDELYLEETLDNFQDEELKSRLNEFGKSVLKKPE